MNYRNNETIQLTSLSLCVSVCVCVTKYAKSSKMTNCTCNFAFVDDLTLQLVLQSDKDIYNLRQFS